MSSINCLLFVVSMANVYNITIIRSDREFIFSLFEYPVVCLTFFTLSVLECWREAHIASLSLRPIHTRHDKNNTSTTYLELLMTIFITHNQVNLSKLDTR